MPDDYRASAYNGHINLEQQRKRAKELLTRLRDGTAVSQQALLERHALYSAPPRLADAQWVIARELGFASWPRSCRSWHQRCVANCKSCHLYATGCP